MSIENRQSRTDQQDLQTEELRKKLREELMKPPFFDGLSTKRYRDSKDPSYYNCRLSRGQKSSK